MFTWPTPPKQNCGPAGAGMNTPGQRVLKV